MLKSLLKIRGVSIEKFNFQLSFPKKQIGLSLHHLLGHESTTSYSGIAPFRKKQLWTMQHINQHWEFSLHHGSELLLQGGHYILGNKDEYDLQLKSAKKTRRTFLWSCTVLHFLTHTTVKQPPSPRLLLKLDEERKVPITIHLAVFFYISPLQ